MYGLALKISLSSWRALAMLHFNMTRADSTSTDHLSGSGHKQASEISALGLLISLLQSHACGPFPTSLYLSFQ